MPDLTPQEPNWSLDHYRIEYRKLRGRFWDLVQHHECTRFIADGDGVRCAMDKGHAGKCGMSVRFAPSPTGSHQMVVQPDPGENPDV